MVEDRNMGLFSGLLGNASQKDIEKQKVENILTTQKMWSSASFARRLSLQISG